jgi:UTP--glucose-1-phosphate uridylyltransferase
MRLAEASATMQKIKKAIFPVAGLGSRFLPATKASPKEMLPIVDKPLIQYAVEEAIAAGITELIFVTSSSKRAIEDHFDTNFELETRLAKAGKQDLLAIVQQVLPKGVNCAYVRQPDTLGLGHAVLCAQPLIDGEPFAVLLADDLIDGGSHSCLQQMVEVYQETSSSVIAVQQIPHTETQRYGIVDLAGEKKQLSKINRIVEKPPVAEAPSDLGVVGRYILTPRIFDCLQKTPAGKGGEFQLTDAIENLLQYESAYAWQFTGTRYDCGSKVGYLQATIAYALQHSEVAEEFRAFLKAQDF